MTDLFEELLVVDLFTLNMVFDTALSASDLDTELYKCLKEMIFEIHNSINHGENFSITSLECLAALDCFDYEISRNWFKNKKIEYQYIGIIVDATKTDKHKASWVAVAFYYSFVLKAHGKNNHSKSLLNRYKTAYFFTTENYQWIWKELPSLVWIQNFTAEYILSLFSSMLDKLNVMKAEVENRRVNGSIESESSSQSIDKKINQISEINQLIELAHYPNRRIRTTTSKPKDNKPIKKKNDRRSMRLNPPEVSKNTSGKFNTDLLNTLDTDDVQNLEASLKQECLVDSAAQYELFEESIDVASDPLYTYWPSDQGHKKSSFELNNIDFSVRQQYISLRELELSSDINTLSAASCQLLFDYLICEIQSNKKKCQIAAVVLFAMITACPIESLLIKGFIEKSGLFFIGEYKAYLQSRLGITKIDKYGDDNINSTDLIKIPLPFKLSKLAVDAGNNHILLDDIKTYLKQVKEKLHLVYLTTSRVESALHVILTRYVKDSNSHIADILCRIEASKAPANYYSSHTHQELIGHYKKALQFLNVYNRFDLSYIDKHSENFSTGSGCALKTQRVQDFFQELRQWVLDSTHSEELFNRFSLFTWYCFFILTGARPNNGMPNVKAVDLEVGWYQVEDKPSRTTRNFRLIPLCDSLIYLLSLYKSYLLATNRPYSVSYSTSIHSIRVDDDIALINLLDTGLEQLIAIKRGDAARAVEPWTPFYSPYGMRHCVRTALEKQRLSMTLINAVMGHEKEKQKVLHQHSSIGMAKILSVKSNFEQLALELGLQDFNDIFDKVVKVHPYVTF